MLSNAEGGLSSSILLVKVKLGGEGVACWLISTGVVLYKANGGVSSSSLLTKVKLGDEIVVCS
jgi:hypothetical protein